MNREQYIREVVKGLNCSTKEKKRVEKDLAADIAAALEQGETWEEIMARMGEPDELAAEFNENLGEKPKSKKKLVIIIAVLIVAVAAAVLYSNWRSPKAAVLTENFEAENVIGQAKAVIELLNQEDYQTLRSSYANQMMQDVLVDSFMDEIRTAIGGDWGEFEKFTSENAFSLKQSGQEFAVVEVVALYQNRSVNYTISFDTDMKLAGLYMK